jgi:hypothetical protein
MVQRSNTRGVRAGGGSLGPRRAQAAWATGQKLSAGLQGTASSGLGRAGERLHTKGKSRGSGCAWGAGARSRLGPARGGAGERGVGGDTAHGDVVVAAAPRLGNVRGEAWGALRAGSKSKGFEREGEREGDVGTALAPKVDPAVAPGLTGV